LPDKETLFPQIHEDGTSNEETAFSRQAAHIYWSVSLNFFWVLCQQSTRSHTGDSTQSSSDNSSKKTTTSLVRSVEAIVPRFGEGREPQKLETILFLLTVPKEIIINIAIVDFL
jgi:hypothetical protein